MDSDEEDFVFFGTTIEREEDSISRNKKVVAESSGQLRSKSEWERVGEDSRRGIQLDSNSVKKLLWSISYPHGVSNWFRGLYCSSQDLPNEIQRVIPRALARDEIRLLRKIINKILILCVIFNILFGICTSFLMVVMIRFALGGLNGLLGPMKVRYVNGDEDIRKYYDAFHLFYKLHDPVVIDDFEDFCDNM